MKEGQGVCPSTPGPAPERGTDPARCAQRSESVANLTPPLIPPVNNPRSASGFSLLEMLVVVVIIAIISTSFAWTLQPSPQRQLQQAADRLVTLLELAASQSLTGEAEISWSPRPDGYDFYQPASQEQFLSTAAADFPEEQLMEDARFSSRQLDAVRISRVEVQGQLMPPDQRLRFRRGLLPLYRITLQSTAQPAWTQVLTGLPNGRVQQSLASGAEK